MTFKEQISRMLQYAAEKINPSEEPTYPTMFGRIQVIENARAKGLKDDLVKEIVIFLNGIEIERVPYSKSALESYKQVYGIPIAAWEEDDEEEFEFDEPTLFGLSVLKR